MDFLHILDANVEVKYNKTAKFGRPLKWHFPDGAILQYYV